ncbi:MAG: hypothetical protein ABSB49_18360, partial [Polyangia bacterium]
MSLSPVTNTSALPATAEAAIHSSSTPRRPRSRCRRGLGTTSRSRSHGRWRKMKGIAVVRLPDGTTSPAEVHWYESHGIGRMELK